MAALEEKILFQAADRPWLWWRYIDDIFLVWHHGEEKLHRFIDFLNQAHPSIKFTADWSGEKMNLLDFQVIREGDRLITDLFTKPTDAHQLLHRTSLSHLKVRSSCLGSGDYIFSISTKRLQYEFTTYTTLQDYYTIQLCNTT